MIVLPSDAVSDQIGYLHLIFYLIFILNRIDKQRRRFRLTYCRRGLSISSIIKFSKKALTDIVRCM